MLLGDFNINLLNYESHQLTEEFLNDLRLHCFQPYILQPTRITDHSATLIDNIYLNSIEHYPVSGNLIFDITDHLPNFLIINKMRKAIAKLNRYRRDYSTFSEHDLINEVESINWEDVVPAGNDVNQIFDSFYSCISNTIDKHVPLKKTL